MKTKLVLTTAFVTSLLASASYAQSSNIYLGVSGGVSKDSKSFSWDTLEDRFDAEGVSRTGNRTPVVDGSSDGKKSGTALKAYVGYKLNPNFAFEFGYADLGKTKQKYSASGDRGDSNREFQFEDRSSSKNKALFVDTVASASVSDKFSVFGKFGVAYVKSKTSLDESGFIERRWRSDITVDNSSRNTQSKWVPKFGIGAEYSLTETVALRAEYERYMNIGEKSLGNRTNVDMISLGLKVGF